MERWLVTIFYGYIRLRVDGQGSRLQAGIWCLRRGPRACRRADILRSPALQGIHPLPISPEAESVRAASYFALW